MVSHKGLIWSLVHGSHVRLARKFACCAIGESERERIINFVYIMLVKTAARGQRDFRAASLEASWRRARRSVASAATAAVGGAGPARRPHRLARWDVFSAGLLAG